MAVSTYQIAGSTLYCLLWTWLGLSLWMINLKCARYTSWRYVLDERPQTRGVQSTLAEILLPSSTNRTALGRDEGLDYSRNVVLS